MTYLVLNEGVPHKCGRSPDLPAVRGRLVKGHAYVELGAGGPEGRGGVDPDLAARQVLVGSFGVEGAGDLGKVQTGLVGRLQGL